MNLVETDTGIEAEELQNAIFGRSFFLVFGVRDMLVIIYRLHLVGLILIH